MSHIPYYGQQEDTHMNKNGFEIRTDMLTLAKDYIEKQAAINKEYYTKMYEIGKVTTDQYLEAIKPYSFDQVLDKAKELYSFVSSKK
jgi:hypothetical protein